MSALYAFMHHAYAYLKGSYCIIMFAFRPPLNACKPSGYNLAFLTPSVINAIQKFKADCYRHGPIDSRFPRGADIRVAWHTPAHTPSCPTPLFSRDISLARGWNNTTFLTRSSPLSLPTPQNTLSPHSQAPSRPLPVSSNILIAWECFAPSLIHSQSLSHILWRQPLYTPPKFNVWDATHTHTHTNTHTNMHIHHWWQLSLRDYCDSKLLRGSVPSGSGVCGIIQPPPTQLQPRPTHIAPFPHPILLPPPPVSAPPPSTLPIHQHTQTNTHTKGGQRRSKRDDNPA